MTDKDIRPPLDSHGRRRTLVGEKLLYSIREACALTSIGRSHLYELIAAGEILTVKVGRTRLVPRSALVDFIERLQAQAS